jgi:hypothetical protein
MFLIRELFDWVALQTGLERGVEWQCAFMPPEVTGAVAVLLERPGDAMQPNLRHNLGAYGFQVLALGPTGSDYWDAYRLADTVFQAMGDVAHATLGDGTYTNEWEADVMQAQSPPYYLGGDERFRFEISTDYIVRARTAALFA